MTSNRCPPEQKFKALNTKLHSTQTQKAGATSGFQCLETCISSNVHHHDVRIKLSKKSPDKPNFSHTGQTGL